MIVHVLKDHEEMIKQKDCELIIIRKLGISSCLLLINAEEYHFENSTKVIVRLSLLEMVEEVKSKLFV